MCNENFTSQSVFRFHIKNVHSASVSAQTDACGMQDNSSQTGLTVQNSNFNKCDNTPAEKEVLRNHVYTLHDSVPTEDELALAIHAHDSSEQAKNFASYLCYYCDNRIISEAQLKEHKCECHGRI